MTISLDQLDNTAAYPKDKKISQSRFATKATTQDDGFFESLINDPTNITTPKQNTVVKGVVTKIDDDFVVVDIGYKSEGKIPITEFKLELNTAMPQIGDIINVFVERLESRGGGMILSRQNAIRAEVWQQLKVMHAANQLVSGIIFKQIKGGFVVYLSGVVAFLPGGQLDVHQLKPTEIQALMNVEHKFKILNMDDAQENVVVSRRAVIEDERSGDKQLMLSTIEQGMILNGIVKNITNYGAFVNLNGADGQRSSVDGLLHINDIAWRRIHHPSEELTLGQEIKVVVIRYEPEKQRIHLGLKQLSDSPWASIEERYKIGDRIVGKITSLTDFFVFLEIEEGIDGSVHSSEITWNKGDHNPKKLFIIGQEVECVIINIDKENTKLFLSIKKISENPWVQFILKNPVGSIITGGVRNITPYAMFVELTGQIDGMIHESDISWDGNGGEKLKKNYAQGDRIQCVIIGADAEKGKIALSIKHLTDDPHKNTYAQYNVGDTISATVTNVHEDHIDLIADNVIPCVIRKSALGTNTNKPNVGDVVTARILDISRDNGINLSLRNDISNETIVDENDDSEMLHRK